MHYWFVESQTDPANAPLAFWTNGGPGCSGLIGFMTEQGPFKPQADGSLLMNEYAWNTVANMVFIEQPCGVGFSYSDEKDDLSNDDAGAALDNYNLIQAFLARYPEYASNSLYITSESYGGHYMPTLAKEIVDKNTAGGNPVLNFKGFAVGNPYTTFYSALPSGLVTLWGHQMVSKPTYDKFSKNCLDAGKDFNMTICEALMMEMYHEVGPDINHYALDYPVCVADERASRGRNQRNWFFRALTSKFSDAFKKTLKLEADASYEPCTDDYAATYLNRADVKAAIHVKDSIKWGECGGVKYSQTDSWHSMTPIYNYLIDGGFGLNILVYSGDDDDVCPTEGSQSWIWDLGYRASSKWQAWSVASQTAGYLTKWSSAKLAFATVHGAGHEVPTYKPAQALALITSYFKGELTN